MGKGVGVREGGSGINTSTVIWCCSWYDPHRSTQRLYIILAKSTLTGPSEACEGWSGHHFFSMKFLQVYKDTQIANAKFVSISRVTRYFSASGVKNISPAACSLFLCSVLEKERF